MLLNSAHIFSQHLAFFHIEQKGKIVVAQFLCEMHHAFNFYGISGGGGGNLNMCSAYAM